MQEPRQCSSKAIDKALDDRHTDFTQARWDFICNAVYKAAIETFGEREKKTDDWFMTGIQEMEPVIAAEGAALQEYKRQPQVRQ